MGLDMWQRLNNCVTSVVTYGTLSPDFVLRLRINQRLWARSPLNPEQWFQRFGHQEAISQTIIWFAYQHLPRYSGLPMMYLQPSDRLELDLCWTEICWFDWELDLYDDFLHHFGKDISMTFNIGQTQTVADLMRNLEQEL
ncbi:MAG: hypothetical protein AB4042_13515 [Leptolyngbyaceae cyanobacterium]